MFLKMPSFAVYGNEEFGFQQRVYKLYLVLAGVSRSVNFGKAFVYDLCPVAL